MNNGVVKNWREFLESQYRWEQKRSLQSSSVQNETVSTSKQPFAYAGGQPSYASSDNTPDPALKRIFDEELARIRSEQVLQIQTDNENLEEKLRQLQQELAYHQAKREAESTQKLDKKLQDSQKIRGSEGAIFSIRTGYNRSSVGIDRQGSHTSSSLMLAESNTSPGAPSTRSGLDASIPASKLKGLRKEMKIDVSTPKISQVSERQQTFDVSTPFVARNSESDSNMDEIREFLGDSSSSSSSKDRSNQGMRLEFLLRSREREEQVRRITSQHCRTLLAEIGASALPTSRLAVVTRQHYEASPTATLSRRPLMSPLGTSSGNSFSFQMADSNMFTSRNANLNTTSELGLPSASIYVANESPSPSSRRAFSSDVHDAHGKTYISASRALAHAAHKTGFADAFAEVLLSPSNSARFAQPSPRASAISTSPAFQHNSFQTKMVSPTNSHHYERK